MSNQSNTKRIARNTLMLYFRQTLIMAVSLYTVRIVLSVLGAEDYGIYNVVAGVVTMFSFLSGAMATASQRYFSFDLGKGDTENLKKTFSVTLTIYALLALLIVLLAETVGLWFVYNKLVIPSERLSAAKWIYQAAVASFLFTLITTPYMSAIIAHENMDVYAYVSIVEVALKLGIVFLLQVLPFDKLIVYGFLLLAVAVINTSLYRLYCIKKYEECKFRFLWDKALFKDMLDFTSWTLFGQFTSIVRNQAVTVLFNQFFTPVVVAARSISLQVTKAVNVFSQNFNTSLYPPIIKEYSAGNKDSMYNLLYNGCKMTFFLLWVFALPLILNMQVVLSLWLKNVPEWTVLFTQLALVEVLVSSLGQPVATAARAPGKMKTYELSLGSLQLIIFVFSWILFKAGYQAWISFVIAIGVNLVMMVLRLVLVHGLVGLPLRQFVVKTVIPLILMVAVSFSFAFMLNRFMPFGMVSSFLQIVITVPVTCIVMFFLGMNSEQREMVVDVVKRKIGKKI